MNDNGYIRKIDELGRIVIPKELRQRLKIHEGENILINSNDKNISLSKYSYIENNINFVNLIGDKASFLTGFNIIITDTEYIIYSSEKYDIGRIDEKLISLINTRESTNTSDLIIGNNKIIKGNIYIEPIIVKSICIGLVIIYDDKNSDFLSAFSKFIASIISIHLDIS